MATNQMKLQIVNWDEKPYQEFPDGSKVTKADVTLGRPEGEDEGLEGSLDSLMAYRPDGTSTLVSQMVLSGVLEGRSGAFVMQGTGTYDGTRASLQFDIVGGSGTDDLAGLSGSAESVSTHDDYPYMPLTLTYELE
jgi:hypothetical protein